MFPYMQFLPITLSLLFTLCEMKSSIYKAKSGDGPQVIRLTTGKAAGVILGGMYGDYGHDSQEPKKSPSGESHVNRAQFTCETRTFQDAQRHKGSSVVATVAAQAQAVKPGLGNESGKEGPRVRDIMRKNWLQDLQPGEQ